MIVIPSIVPPAVDAFQEQNAAAFVGQSTNKGSEHGSEGGEHVPAFGGIAPVGGGGGGEVGTTLPRTGAVGSVVAGSLVAGADAAMGASIPD